jgi:hypothetical protein
VPWSKTNQKKGTKKKHCANIVLYLGSTGSKNRTEITLKNFFHKTSFSKKIKELH